jgi:hypothetical protein
MFPPIRKARPPNIFFSVRSASPSIALRILAARCSS